MSFKIGKNCRIHPSCIIDVKEGFIGDGAYILEGVRIEGRKVEIGRESYMGIGATIGGGSCFDTGAFLKAGDWLHLGPNSHVNIARGVTVGGEVGIGIDTKIFTHGAYIDSLNLGAPAEWGPVNLGDNVWLPNAWVNPNINIGSNVVVAARSLINKSIPEGSLAAGTPAIIIKENAYPKKLSKSKLKIKIKEIVDQAWLRYIDNKSLSSFKNPPVLIEGSLLKIIEPRNESTFSINEKKISGKSGEFSKVLKDQFRRNGVRFRFKSNKEFWVPWKNHFSKI